MLCDVVRRKKKKKNSSPFYEAIRGRSLAMNSANNEAMNRTRKIQNDQAPRLWRRKLSRRRRFIGESQGRRSRPARAFACRQESVSSFSGRMSGAASPDCGAVSEGRAKRSVSTKLTPLVFRNRCEDR